MTRRTGYLLMIGLLSACAHTASRRGSADDAETSESKDNSSVSGEAAAEGNLALEESVAPGDRAAQETLAQLELDVQGVPARDGLPLSGIVNPKSLQHPSVQNWIRQFTKNENSRFQRHMDRAEPYRKVVQEIFVKNGLPADIFYLGIVESGYISGARSVANAVGVWQFIRPTGERYGLEVNSWVDERRDVIRATEAAAKYLKDLHNVFNSWELALAAYNTGEGRVLRAILRGKSRDFWTLLGKGVLPQETQDYVPKFVAAAYIYENAQKFGFSLPEDEEHPRLAVVDLPARVRLSDIAKLGNLDAEKLAFYNPHLLRGLTPPGDRSYKVWVPRGQQRSVINALAALPRGASSLVTAQSLGYSPALAGVTRAKTLNPFAPSPRVRTAGISLPKLEPKVVATASRRSGGRTREIYVKRGETLEIIAKRYGSTVEQLKQINRLRSGKVLAGQELKVPAASPGFSPLKAPVPVVKYRVRRGDSLTSIADQFGTTVDKLRKDNRLRRQTVFAGEVIKVDTRGI